MTACWLITSFNYYMLQFLINTFKQVYVTAILSSVSEIMGIVAGGAFYTKLGLSKSLSMSYLIGVIGAVAIVLYGLQHQDELIFPLLVLIAKFGIASAFNILYISHADIFPVLFAATALGFANFVSRIATGISPVIAFMEEPVPMVAFMLLAMIGVFIPWGV